MNCTCHAAITGVHAVACKMRGMAKKRGYSRDFTPQTERRVTVTIDRVPPTLIERVRAKAKREGVSVRALTLTLWRKWSDGEIAIDSSTPKGER